MRKRFAAGTAAAAVLLTPAAALAQEVVVEPLEAGVGDAVVLRGEGCVADGPVDFFLEPEVGDPIDFGEEPVLADAQGAFEAPDLVVPEADPGSFTVVAECGTERFEAPFTLLAASAGTPAATPAPSPTTGGTGGGTDTDTGPQVQAPSGGVDTGATPRLVVELVAPAPAPSSAPAPAAASARPQPAALVLPRSQPVRVRVPTVGVDSRLVTLGLQPDGTLEVPERADIAGWYTGSPTPGELGPSVLAGHVDSVRGPGVFFRLRDLAAGDRVVVDRADGTTATFEVERVEQHRKNAFPTQCVYGDIDHAGLRLITCGGTFDRSTGHYRSNVVVYARLADRPAAPRTA